MAAGRDQVTVRLWVDRSGAARLVHHLELLDEVESWCRGQRLLTLAAPPEVRAFRVWFATQVLTQVLA